MENTLCNFLQRIATFSRLGLNIILKIFYPQRISVFSVTVIFDIISCLIE
jgi:hypothetical protein